MSFKPKGKYPTMREFVLCCLAFAVVALGSSVWAADPVADAIANLDPSRAKADRLAAIRWLKKQSEDAEALQAVEALTAACNEEDAEIRRESVITLGILCYRNDQPCPLVLVEAMLDPDKRISTNARAVVGFCKVVPKEAVPLLLKCAADLNGDVRSIALMPLARAGGKDPMVLAVLHQAAHDRYVHVRTNAAAAIWQMTGDLSQVVPCWLLLTEDSEGPAAEGDLEKESLNIAAFAGAMMLRKQSLARPREMCDVLVKLVDSNHQALRRAAVRNLRAMAMASPEAKQVLEEQGVPELLKKLSDDTDDKVASMAALGLQEFTKQDPADGSSPEQAKDVQPKSSGSSTSENSDENEESLENLDQILIETQGK